MSFVPAPRGHAVVTALCLALISHVAAAQTGAGAGGAATQRASQPTGPLKVWLDAPGTTFDKAQLEQSLAHELGREVVLTESAAGSAVQVHFDGAARADVHYTTPSGEQLSRSVELPPDRDRSVQVVSWLTVNLVRDEASELLDELRARRKEEADARAAEEKAAEEKAAEEKAAADKAAAEAVARAAEQAKKNKPATPPPAPADTLLRDPLRSFDVAVATPLSLIHDSPKRELKWQLAVGYGESGAIRGIAISPGVLRLRQDLLGIAIGGGAVLVGGSARGIIVAPGYSQLNGDLVGVQLGAGAALQLGNARGAVAAAGGAIAGNVTGVVVSGGISSAKSLHGIEISGGVNAAGELQGIALAPINVHRRVKGLQFGIVNVAEEVDGAAIGVISIAKNGRVQPVLWGQNNGSVHVAIKSIAGSVFTQIGGGIELNAARFSYDAGVGMHLRLGPSWFLEPGLHYSGFQSTADASGSPDEHQLHYLAQVGLRLGDKLDLLAAAGARHRVVGGSGARFAPEVRVGIGFF